jgi:hypothetical protein
METYIGYRSADYETAYAKYFDENMKPIPLHAQEGLAHSPYAKGKIPPLSKIAQLQASGYADLETGYTMEADGSLRIAILTQMPHVAPAMWDWWFSWHGSQANRYKLWHPKAHKHAVWADGRADLPHYVGRHSRIEEYIGKSLEKALIQFIDPQTLGLPASNDKETFICARVGYRDYPLDFGYLIHHVRRTNSLGISGAEMRSRFYMGGSSIQFRSQNFILRGVSKLLQKLIRLPEQRAKDLLTHCAEEMNHLARILPEIYAEFGQTEKSKS